VNKDDVVTYVEGKDGALVFISFFVDHPRNVFYRDVALDLILGDGIDVCPSRYNGGKVVARLLGCLVTVVLFVAVDVLLVLLRTRSSFLVYVDPITAAPRVRVVAAVVMRSTAADRWSIVASVVGAGAIESLQQTTT